MAVSFVGGGNRSTRRKPPTCPKSLTQKINIFLIITCQKYCVCGVILWVVDNLFISKYNKTHYIQIVKKKKCDEY